MSEQPPPTPPAAPEEVEETEQAPGLAERYGLLQKAGGLLVPFLTVALAFVIGGLVIIITTGKNPLSTYRAIFDGAGLNWFFPWVNGIEREFASYNLQQTLLTSTTLVLVGLAVAFAFRCGLFNIGGQGQYIFGGIFAVWVGSSFEGLNPFLHIVLALVCGTLMGAVWAGIAGLLKATVGAHEVISTIMLNWIAVWIGTFLFSVDGPLQNDEQAFVPISREIAEGAKLPVWWGDELLQGLHAGFFIAISALVVYWVILSRTTLGFGVRAVGFNPEASRYSGTSVARNYFLAMAISGGFAGLAGAIDVLGWQYDLSTNDVSSQFAFTGIAVALLGRNKAVGVAASALLFGSLFTGTSTRNLDAEIFDPQLASSLTVMIQGLVVLFVGADVIILLLLRRLRRKRQAAVA